MVTKLKRMPTEAEVIELLNYIQIQSIYITDDYSVEMEGYNPRECASADKLIDDLSSP